jgi:hypothetical protein
MKTRIKIVFVLFNLIFGSCLLIGDDNRSLKRIFGDESKNIPKTLLKIISIDLDKIPLERALSIVTEKGKFKLNYNRRDIPINKKIYLKMDNATIIKVLEKILRDTDAELVVTKGGSFAIVPKIKKRSAAGKIVGKVSEIQNNRNIPGVYIKVVNTNLHAFSNEKGEFQILNVPPGSYHLKSSANGFNTVVKTDVTIGPKRITYLDLKMKEKLPWFKETVHVEESYFHKNDAAANNNIKVAAEELKRFSGTAGLLGRMITVFPGVSFFESDESTDLLVRGGGPTENGFFIDNIEIANISHLPRLGSVGGAFSAINPELLQSVEFYSGGFSAEYGDYLSSITNISFREGNRKEFDGEVDINLLMTGVVMEGPVSKDKGAWLVSIRKSYTGLVFNIADTLDTTDSQLKITYDFSDKQKFTLLNIIATGNFNDFYGLTTEENFYTQNTIGINLKSIWNTNSFSNTSISYTFLNRTDSETYPINETDHRWKSRDRTRYFTLRNSNFLFFKNNKQLELGIQLKHQREEINIYNQPYNTIKGEFYPVNIEDFAYQVKKSSLYLSYQWQPFKKFRAMIGLRGDYSSTHKAFHLSPRVSTSFQVSRKVSINGTIGLFYQPIPLRFLAFMPQHLTLKDIKATHYTLGIEYIDANNRLTLGVFKKQYHNLLMDPKYPNYLASELAIDRYYYPDYLTNGNSGYAKGIELLIHKKLVKHFYGLFSLTVMKSRYQDLYGKWQKSSYENPYMINLMGGYKPNASWEFFLKLTIIGGSPYTSFNSESSSLYKTGIYYLSKFNQDNYPVYNTLNLRIKRRFNFRNSNITIYLDIWNALNKKNIYDYKWENDYNTNLPILPVLGINYEF